MRTKRITFLAIAAAMVFVIVSCGGGGGGGAASPIVGGNNPPVANAGPDQNLGLGPLPPIVVTLDGSMSTDPDGDTLTYLWEITNMQWTDAIISSATTSVTSFNTDVEGTYEIRLTVSDGSLSASDITIVTISEGAI